MGTHTSDTIKQFRREKHISQQELAKRTGVAQSSISRLENGESILDDTEAKVLEYIRRTTKGKSPTPLTNGNSATEKIIDDALIDTTANQVSEELLGNLESAVEANVKTVNIPSTSLFTGDHTIEEMEVNKKSENVNVQNTDISDAFVEPSEETLWRYMSFAKFMDVLKNGLFFSKASLFNDPAEGHIPPKNVKEILAIGKKINENYHPKWEGDRIHGSTPPFHSGIDTNGISHKTLCSCWYSQPDQSVSMWERYGSEGVAIKTTLKRVKKGVEGYGKYFRIGKIKYIDYDNTVDFNLNIRWENNQPHYDHNFNYRRFLHKQKEYQDENEVRLMILAEYHNHLLFRSMNRSETRTIPFKIDQKWKNNWACLEIPTNGIHLSITPGILIERVFVSNKAEPYMTDLIEQQFDDMGIQPRPKVEQSKLLEQQHIWD